MQSTPAVLFLVTTILTRLLASSANETNFYEWVVGNSIEFASGNSISLTSSLLVMGSPGEGTTEDGYKSGIVSLFRTLDDDDHYDDHEGRKSRSRKEKEDFLQKTLELVGGRNDNFGYSVAAASDSQTFIVGAPYPNTSEIGEGRGRGYAIVYDYDESTESWEQLGDYIVGDADGERAGSTVDISDDGRVIAVASLGDEFDRGRVRLFVYDEEKKNWSPLGSDLYGYEHQAQLGVSLSLIGNVEETYLAVGAPGINSGKGHVQVSRYNKQVRMWEQLGLDIAGTRPMDRTGTSVSLGFDKDKLELYVAVGSPSEGYDGGPDVGNVGTNGHVQVYRYRLNEDDTEDEQLWDAFVPEIGEMEEDDETGMRVALSNNGNRLAVASPNHNSVRGMVRIFDYNTELESYTIVGQPIEGENAGDKLGAEISINEDRVAVSALYGGYGNVYSLRAKRYNKMSGNVMIIILVIGSCFAACFILGRQARRRGFRWSSAAKAISFPAIGRRNKLRQRSSPVETADRTEWPFPFFTDAERARIVEIQKAEEDKAIEGVFLHGMIRSDGDGSRRSSGNSRRSSSVSLSSASHGDSDLSEDSSSSNTIDESDVFRTIA
jgi:hypothetical protein